ncbi:Shikimate dehydrogenase (NADP(+)) [Buchnera aphidicola (Tetraneura ulmi)]|uniref:shikimate dehydrogenase n=1 Tax=Buchnera aphidicola TaxID=9 RepID=UPI00346487C9
MDNYIVDFAVFGNPISHSKSPIVHNIFSKKYNIKKNYISFLVFEKNFYLILDSFFKNFGKGANITAPFKENAFIYSDIITENARVSGSVNTLKKLKNGKILGDNTDGMGLLYDLNRIKFLKEKCNILILGAGGVVRGILQPLLSLGNSIYILNRTKKKAENLKIEFSKYGSIEVFKKENKKNIFFDLLINAIPLGGIEDFSNILNGVLHTKINCYDICYRLGGLTPFLFFCKKKLVNNIHDGIGMLVAQAAYSFSLWHNIFPEIDPIISILKK